MPRQPGAPFFGRARKHPFRCAAKLRENRRAGPRESVARLRVRVVTAGPTSIVPPALCVQQRIVCRPDNRIACQDSSRGPTSVTRDAITRNAEVGERKVLLCAPDLLRKDGQRPSKEGEQGVKGHVFWATRPLDATPCPPHIGTCAKIMIAAKSGTDPIAPVSAETRASGRAACRSPRFAPHR
jgi:hypothetical protein